MFCTKLESVDSGIHLREVRILTLPREAGILILRKTIPELLLRKEGIGAVRIFIIVHVFVSL